MMNLGERILVSERFQKSASVLPILMGLIPRQKSDYFELRESIISSIKTRAVEVYKAGKHRRGDSIMVKAQEQDKRLEEDKDFVENFAARVKFAQAPLRQVKVQVVEKPKVRKELVSAEDQAFRDKMKKAEVEILALIEATK